ncbi:MAG TPA: hypothetical protein VHA52_05635, partial [Candidatus Babeliaceae bacterium]|nr:hypothetical protein [Candidatus Babeliaceae bacterium]
IDKQSIGTIVCNFLCANGDFAKAGVKPIGICTRNVDFHIELATEKKQLQSNRNVTVLPLNEDIIMPNNMVPM